MPSARQKRHLTVSMKLADCQDSCRVFVLTSRSDRVIVCATSLVTMLSQNPRYKCSQISVSGKSYEYNKVLNKQETIEHRITTKTRSWMMGIKRIEKTRSWMMGIKRIEKIRNEETRAKTRVAIISDRIREPRQRRGEKD